MIVDEFKISTFFKNDDHAILFFNISNNNNSRLTAAVLSFLNEMDKDRSGEISKTEFINYCRGKNPKVEIASVEEMFARLDEDNSGIVSLCEFMEKFEEVQKFINRLELKFENKSSKFNIRKTASNVFDTLKGNS